MHVLRGNIHRLNDQVRYIVVPVKPCHIQQQLPSVLYCTSAHQSTDFTNSATKSVAAAIQPLSLSSEDSASARMPPIALLMNHDHLHVASHPSWLQLRCRSHTMHVTHSVAGYYRDTTHESLSPLRTRRSESFHVSWKPRLCISHRVSEE